MSDVLQDHLKAVRDRFTKLLDERLDELEDMRDRIELDANRAEAYENIQFIAHKIAGTAGILGYADLGSQAKTAENAIIELGTKNMLATAHRDTLQKIDIFIETAADISSRSYWENA